MIGSGLFTYSIFALGIESHWRCKAFEYGSDGRSSENWWLFPEEIMDAAGDNDHGRMTTDIHNIPITEHNTFAEASFDGCIG